MGASQAFPVDGGRVETGRLPHLQLVDGGTRDKIASPEPAFAGIPFIGFFGGPNAPLIGVISWLLSVADYGQAEQGREEGGRTGKSHFQI